MLAQLVLEIELSGSRLRNKWTSIRNSRGGMELREGISEPIGVGFGNKPIGAGIGNGSFPVSNESYDSVTES